MGQGGARIRSDGELNARLRTRLYAACAVILVAGLSSAGWIYIKADDGPDLSGAYQIVVVNGVPQPIAPNESRMYQRDLQRYGGKMALIFDDINRWFAGLWRGKSLALTVGFLTLVFSSGILLIAAWLPDGEAPGRTGE
jgi:hypothetical protein